MSRLAITKSLVDQDIAWRSRDERAWANLGSFLMRSELLFFLKQYGLNEDRLNAIDFDCNYLDPPFKSLLEFLCLGKMVSRKSLSPWLASKDLDLLVESGLAITLDGKCQMQHLRLVYHFGNVMFVEAPGPAPRYYYGSDTIALSRFVLGLRGDTLDLCCGVGAQSLVAAISTDRVVGLDIEARNADLFKINASINGVLNKCSIKIGNLFETEFKEKFDNIICNPPLLPVPAGIPFPSVGNGGSLGIDFTLEILSRFNDVVKDGGTCMVLGTLLGSEEGPYLDDIVNTAITHGLDITVSIIAREGISLGGNAFNSIVDTVCNVSDLGHSKATKIYLEHFNNHNADSLFTVVFLVKKKKKGKSNRFQAIPYFYRNKEAWNV